MFFPPKLAPFCSFNFPEPVYAIVRLSHLSLFPFSSPILRLQHVRIVKYYLAFVTFSYNCA